jgi:hypothetical protein
MIVNRSGRREHEIAMLAVGLFGGAGGLLGELFTDDGVTPPVLASLGPGWALVFFGATLVSSCIALSGIFLPWRRLMGLHIEASGLWLQSAAWIGYGLVVFAKLGTDGFLFTLLVCFLSIAHILRALRIPGEARVIAQAAIAVGLGDELEAS